METRVHHPYSPSTLQSLEACPCWQSKQGGKVHPRTIIGTMGHEVAETGEDNLKLGDEDVELVAECIDFFSQRKAAMPGATELKETYLVVDDETFSDGTTTTTGGYIDCALISADVTYAEVFDWKLGLHRVEEAGNNMQGVAYVLGMFRAYPTLQRVTVYFKQPAIDFLTHQTFVQTDIPVLYLRVQVIVAKARAARLAGDFSTAQPMVPACNFCKHIGVCPSVTKLVCSVGKKFFPLEIPENITPSMVHSPEDTSIGLRLAGVVNVWADAFKSRLTDRVLRREAPCPDGYSIQSRSTREIVDEKKYREAALKRLTEEEYSATLTPGLGKAEDKIKDKAARGQKTAAVSEFKQELEDTGAVERGMPYSFLKLDSGKNKSE